jgi:MFS transporter, DHA1 family, tetracycline resistance protein
LKNSPLFAIFLIVLVDVLGLTIIIPLLPIYAESLGATPFVAGLLISSYGLCQLLAGPVLGQWSDRIGRKPVLLISQVGTLIGFIILAESHTLWLVFLSRIIDGLTAGNISVAQAHIADVTEPKSRAKAFGLIGVAFSIGFLVGPAISGLLAHHSVKAPIYVAVGLSALSILATSMLLPNRRPALEKPEEAPHSASPIPLRIIGRAMFDERLGPLLWQFLFFTFAFSMFIAGFPLFAVRRYLWEGVPFGVVHVGWVFALMGLIGIIVQGGLIGKLVEKAGEKMLVVTGFAWMAVGAAMLGRSPEMIVLLAGIIVFSIGMSVLRPSLTSMVAHAASARERGMAIGMTQATMSISQIVAPAVGGAIIQQGHLGAWCGAVSTVATIGILLALRHRPVSGDMA